MLLRAADVALKERRQLVLLVHETPLHLRHLRLLVQVTEMGAVVTPVPTFYHRPETLQAVKDQTVNRVLDFLDVELDCDLFPRWASPRPRPDPTGNSPAESGSHAMRSYG